MVLILSSTVEKAEIGVKSTSGAIVHVRESNFNDCEIGIQIENYTHDDIGATEMGDRNASYVDETIFTVTAVQNFSHANTDFSNYSMIHLDHVFGVHVQGCTFDNQDANTWDCGQRGIGLTAENSTFSIHQSGTATLGLDNCVTYDGLTNSFNALSQGIYCFESGSPTRRTNNTIHGSDFTLCEIAIHASGNHRMLITNCQLVDNTGVDYYASSATSCTGGYQMVLFESVEEFVIQKNQFSASPLYYYPQPISMIRIDDCGTKDNKI